MAKTKVEIEIGRNEEYALMERYGRRHSTLGLVRNAIQEAVRLQEKGVAFEKPQKPPEGPAPQNSGQSDQQPSDRSVSTGPSDSQRVAGVAEGVGQQGS